MGMVLNPGNSGFEEIAKSDYVDKTGLIGLINRTIGTSKSLSVSAGRADLENPMPPKRCVRIMIKRVIRRNCLPDIR